jgi:transposase
MVTLPKVFIGVDISKNNLDIFIYPQGNCFKISNSQNEIEKFIKKLSKLNLGQIACEATGGYEKLLVKILKNNSYNCWVVDPRRIKGFIISRGCKSKTDKIDAQKIAEFVAQNTKDYEEITKTKNEAMLQDFVNRRNDLTKFLSTEKSRLSHPSHESYISSIKNLIKTLEKEIKSIDKQISAIINNDAELSKKKEFLESIPGIGGFTAALLLSFVPELGKISNNEAASLVGVCPYNRESGLFKGKRFIGGGRVVPRNALYMCAITTIKYHLPLKAFYDRLIGNKKPFKVAIVAVMRKIIVMANSILKKGELCRV